ncbi:hypothetical protein BRADI_2g17911v3 [Brachypodium distachyon]|uniref:Uncharacterized protein n=1 Tax=Brachypodium distachyon TaxID=15368 RepID=A0A2K2D948_BRADI|nr:hypothetical protein BRADI_2g17911v3 [Brachypodium distachyon]
MENSLGNCCAKDNCPHQASPQKPVDFPSPITTFLPFRYKSLTFGKSAQHGESCGLLWILKMPLSCKYFL